MAVPDRIVSGFKVTLVARVGHAVANGLLVVLLARVLLTPDEYGLLFLVVAIVGVVQLLADLGVARSAARYVAEGRETDPGTVPFILRSSLRYKVVLIVLVGAGVIAGRGTIARALETPAVAPLLVVATVYLAGQSLTAYGETLCQGFNRVDLSAVVRIANDATRVVAVVGLTAAGFGVTGALVGYAAGAVVGAAIGLWLLYRQFYRGAEDSGGSRRLRNRILAYSVPLTASQSADVIDRRIDTVLVGLFLSPLAVSFYVLGKQITEFLMVPAGSLGFSISPTYGEQKANDALEHAARLYETSLEYVLALYVPAGVGLIVVADPAVTLVFGAGYAGAAPVLQILGIYAVFQAVTTVTTHGLDYLGRAKHRAIAKVVTALGNLGLNVLLIPVYGVEGAAAATVLTFGTYTLATVYVMHRELALDLVRIGRALALTGAVSTAMGAAVAIAVAYVSGLVTLVAVVGLGVAIWAPLVVASGLVDPGDTIAMLRGEPTG